MQILEVHHSPGELHRYVLLPGQTYTIGRKECRLPLPNGDPSISRHHATIVVHTVSSRAVQDPAAEAETSVQDFSKHGTLVNRELIGRDNNRFIYSEDLIKFGKRVKARVLPLRLVLAHSAELDETRWRLLMDAASRLGALVVQDPVPSPETFYDLEYNCLGFLYVAHDGYEVTPNVLLAMSQGYAVTTVEYVVHLLDALRCDSGRMPNEFPPLIFPRPHSYALAVEEYCPPARIFYNPGSFLQTKPQPSQLLRAYTFLLSDVELKSAYESVLQLCGAVSVFVSPEKVTTWHGYTHETRTVALASEAVYASLTALIDEGKEKISDKVKGRSGKELLLAAYMHFYRNGVAIVPEGSVKRALYVGSASEICGRQGARCLSMPHNDEHITETSPLQKRSHSNSNRSSNCGERSSKRASSRERTSHGPLESSPINTPHSQKRVEGSPKIIQPSPKAIHQAPEIVRNLPEKTPLGPSREKHTPSPLSSHMRPTEAEPEPEPHTASESNNNNNNNSNNNSESLHGVALLERRPIVAHAASEADAQGPSSPRLRISTQALHSDPLSIPVPVSISVLGYGFGPQPRAVHTIDPRGTNDLSRQRRAARMAFESTGIAAPPQTRSVVVRSMHRAACGVGVGVASAAQSHSARRPQPRRRSLSADSASTASTTFSRRGTSTTIDWSPPPARVSAISSARQRASRAAAAGPLNEALPLATRCAEFLAYTLEPFALEAVRAGRRVARQHYMDAVQRRFLEDGAQRVQEFLASISHKAMDKEDTDEAGRRAAYKARARAMEVLRSMRATFDAVRAPLPPTLVLVRDSARCKENDDDNDSVASQNGSARRRRYAADGGHSARAKENVRCV